MEIRRGQVWWWNCPSHNRTHIQEGTRPVVIVSNDDCNKFSDVFTIVPLSTKIKRPYPQQVPIVFNEGVSMALADQITTIPIEELHRYVCDLPQFQMDQIDTAIAIQLGFVDVRDRPYATSFDGDK